MSSQERAKPQGYITVAADVNFLQRIICCNHDIGNHAADTPTSRKSVAFTFADDDDPPTIKLETPKAIKE